VLYVRPALSDVYLKKAKRSIFSYTPTGAVMHAAKSAMEKDFQKKISLIGLTVEIEVTDSVTGKALGQLIETRGSKQEPTSWEEVESLFRSFGTRFRCRMDNIRRKERVDCRAS